MSLKSSDDIAFEKPGCDCKTKQPITEAFNLKPGGIYCIECDHTLSEREYKGMRKQLGGIYDVHGITFIILDGGYKMTTVPDDLIEKITNKLISEGKL